MDITFKDYIQNPMGKKNAVMSAAMKEIMRKTYKKKFDNLLLREHGKIEYHLYTNSKDGSYWAHFKIPSETVKDFYYDVVIKFTGSKSIGGGGSLDKYNVQFYSNDPAFVYNYAYVFAKNNLFIKELASKMSKTALRTAAKEKNPNNDVGYVKTLYFAYLVMENRKLFSKIKFDAEAKTFNSQELLGNIEDAEEKIAQRQEEGKKVSKAKKITVDSKTYGTLKKYIKKDTDTSHLQVKTTNTVNKISKAKTTKIIKKK